jgi:acyl carrier protein
MTREEIIEQVNSVLAEEFEVADSNFEADSIIKDALALDSLSLVDLVAIIQYTYKIQVPMSDLPKIKTFNDLYDYIEEHLKDAQ